MIGRLLALAPFIALAIAALAPLGLPTYQVSVITYVMIASIACFGLVLTTGVAGMVSFGQAAFVGLGAYASAYLSAQLGLSPWLGLAGALIGAAAVATLIGAITVRMSGHYLALATLCFGISFYFLIGNSDELGRFNGMTGIPPAAVGGIELRSEQQTFGLALVALVLVVVWCRRLLASRCGRVLRSLRTGAVIAETFGASAQRHRLIAFVAAAVIAALSGWLYAHVQRFLNPTPFGLNASIDYLFMTVIGGSGQVWGALVGAGLVTVIKHELQDALRPIFGATTRFELLAFAALMIVVLHRARKGLWPFLQQVITPYMAPPAPVAPLILPSRRAKPDHGLPVLSATGLRRTFGGLMAVDDVSFDVRSGEILGVLGPNGAGKSTLFNLISGGLPRSGGELSFLGTPLARVSARDMCARGLSRTFQHAALVSEMSLIENVAIGATHLGRCGVLAASCGLDATEERRLLGWSQHLLDRVGLGDKAWDSAGTLSLGHQRILEIARALAADPVLLLLDEPAAGLRANEKTLLADLLLRLRAEGLAIILVEHDMEFVFRLADRLMVMNFGRRIAFGQPEEVRADAGVQEAYLGVAA
ncbi:MULTISPECIES: branched-chain amino acid ABC transporter ATP-binding protein/permease [unclassified Bradyrhizobium]|uniref:branched-chain amino acid ABC transporter ATP-binding protein/permease n=1 Tax=unclassified Bradyrhizobium TaxID=2631580 RepID=UPI00114416D7|nr:MULTISPECIES: branched-chain amino acid ABC transporter ATP-binding protein/permease [unclassified Bradyrhizobium]MCP1848868.1 branched-chain amino acid transport system permease protein [Bradyrhizobium sp. USDA 4541]